MNYRDLYYKNQLGLLTDYERNKLKLSPIDIIKNEKKVKDRNFKNFKETVKYKRKLRKKYEDAKMKELEEAYKLGQIADIPETINKLELAQHKQLQDIIGDDPPFDKSEFPLLQPKPFIPRFGAPRFVDPPLLLEAPKESPLMRIKEPEEEEIIEIIELPQVIDIDEQIAQVLEEQGIQGIQQDVQEELKSKIEEGVDEEIAKQTADVLLQQKLRQRERDIEIIKNRIEAEYDLLRDNAESKRLKTEAKMIKSRIPTEKKLLQQKRRRLSQEDYAKKLRKIETLEKKFVELIKKSKIQQAKEDDEKRKLESIDDLDKYYYALAIMEYEREQEQEETEEDFDPLDRTQLKAYRKRVKRI